LKKIIITGCCRSGQRRVHASFGQVKLLAGYEQDVQGADITISWMLGVDGDDYMGAHEPYWNRHVDEVWHNVRDPLRCIPSMAARIKGSLWVWQSQYTGLHPARPTFPNRRMFASLFWVKWNEEVERRGPVWQYRVEDINEVWPEMWDRLGEPLRPMDPRSESYRGQEREKNLPPIEPLTYDEIKAWSPSVCDEVRRMAARYGYADED
jgi:hypothetical protein